MKRKQSYFAITTALVAASVATGCLGSSSGDPVIESIEFIGMDAPTTATQKADAYSAAKVRYNYIGGVSEVVDLKFHAFMNTTDVIGGKVVGGLLNANDQPLTDADGVMASDGPDGQTILAVPGLTSANAKANALALLTHYEYRQTPPNDGNPAGADFSQGAWSALPALMSKAMLDQDKKSGALSVTAYEPVSFKGVNGGWIHCMASNSPWGTHLGSEEYEPDAKVRGGFAPKAPGSDDGTQIDAFSYYYFGNKATANPYHYGLTPEVRVAADGKASVVKHYAPGRLAREMMRFASDRRTGYTGDDGAYTSLTMFVADHADDISAGTLYAAKFTQTSDEKGGAGTLQWIRLGAAADAEIKAFVDAGIKFGDMFEVANADPADASYTKVRTYTGTEWLRLRTTNAKGMSAEQIRKAAAFLETRRYAALKGATTEFNKMEGIAFNQKDSKMYLTVSRIEGSMLAVATDPKDDIRLKERMDSGAVWEMKLASGVKDADGNAIASDFVGTNVASLTDLYGGWSSTKDADGNNCRHDKICGPDNVHFMEKARVLLIGEDTSRRFQNYLWAYHIDSKKLARIFSAPMGAEVTGLNAYENLNGFTYITSNFQHPGDFNPSNYKNADSAEVVAKINTQWNNKKKAAIGYLGTTNGAIRGLN